MVRTPFYTLLHAKFLELETTKVGIVVGRRVGNAVKRNRLKRKFREIVRASHSEMSQSHHCIVYPKVSLLQACFQEVQESWRATLIQNGIIPKDRP